MKLENLYDNDGSAINNREHLKDALGKWEHLYEKEMKANPYRELNTYVIPADVHF